MGKRSVMSALKRLLSIYPGVLVSALFLALYAATAQRGVGWQDSGYFQYRVVSGDYAGEFGLALAHPLYIGAARLFTSLFPPSLSIYAINLFSGLGMATALLLLTQNVRRLGGNAWSALMAATLLGLSHMAWWLSTLAEVYTWSLALLMLECYLLMRYLETREFRSLVYLMFANGIHLSLHNFALLSLPVYCILPIMNTWPASCRRADASPLPWYRILFGMGVVGVAWLAGGTFLWREVVAAWQRGMTVADMLGSLLFGYGYQEVALSLVPRQGWRIVGVNMGLALLSFANPCWWYLTRAWRELSAKPLLRCMLALLTALHALFWIRYFVPDQATFILPLLGLLALWAGVGSAERGAPHKFLKLRWATGLLCAVALPYLLKEVAHGTLRNRRDLPGRAEAAYWLLPWKHHEDSAQRFVESVDREMEPGSVLIADPTAAGPLLAARAGATARRTWRLLPTWHELSVEQCDALLSDRSSALYVVTPMRGYIPAVLLKGNNHFERQGALYRVTRGGK